MGTAAGLQLGLKAANLDSRLVSVRVTAEKLVNPQAMVKLIKEVNSLIHSRDVSFPEFEFYPEDLDIRHGYFGERYALFTEKGMKAVSLMKQFEGIKLDGTYTGKTLAAVIDDANSGSLQGKTVLFWNTLNSREFPEAISNIDYHVLPRAFHRYFEEEVQPLARVF
jgi:D-cysteine desulfhydrase